jgi:indole-3-glycerol phosphate synthase
MSQDDIKNKKNKDSDYEEITSETDHVPDDDIKIISEEGGSEGIQKKDNSGKKDSNFTIVDNEHEGDVQDKLSDEYSNEEKIGDDISIITDEIEIKEDEADIKADDVQEEVDEILQKSGNVLAKICEDKISHVAEKKISVPEDLLLEKIAKLPKTRGFIDKIEKRVKAGENALIGEIKKASPSKGVIRRYFNPEEIAIAYEEGGATCISVLTDLNYFQGKDKYIDIVKNKSKLPVLRKDFILDSYQVVESRALGADCILLIMAILDTSKAIELESKANELGMDVLIEVHDEAELEGALKLKSKLIGINNRNLKTLGVDLSNSERLAPLVPSDRIVVCESGINGFSDVVRMNSIGIKTFLVGDAIMSKMDVKLTTQGLLGNIE